MLSLLALSLICLFLLPLAVLAMVLFSVPFLVIMAIFPWLLRLAAVVLLLRALMDQPFHLVSLAPAAVALLLSLLLS